MPEPPSRSVHLRGAFAYHRAGRLVEAELQYGRALRSAPTSATVHHLLGMLLHQTGRHQESLKLLRTAVALRPSNAAFHNSLGSTLGRIGKFEEAVSSLREAIRLNTKYAEAHNNLGLALAGLGRREEAVESLRMATALKPGYIEALGNLANALRAAGRVEEAIAVSRRGVALRPKSAKVWWPLVKSLEQRGPVDEVIEGFRRIVELEPRSASAHSALLYTLHYDPRYDRAALFTEHLEWAKLHGRGAGEKVSAERPSPPPSPAGRGSNTGAFQNNRKLRVAYVSPDFRDHTVPRFIEPALTHHDRSRFEIFCYSDVARSDAVTRRLQGLPLEWRNIVGMPDDQVEQLIRADGIDILVDLRGHAAGNRLTLFARKPAPVQVTMVGYFDTTGLSQMDWRITDAIQDPSGESEQFHTEKLARLPGSCWCYRPDDDAPECAPPPSPRSGFVTFGSLNKLLKVSPQCAAMWGRVLRTVPRSKLLVSISGADERNVVRDRLARGGIPAEAIDLRPRTTSRREYLNRFNEIDIALDTFPFNGITTTCDALWMGVPVVTLAGQASVSRASKSILCAARLDALTADAEEEFVRVAVNLAHDFSARARLRAGMRELVRRSRLTDGEKFTADLEAAYETAVKQNYPN